MRIKFWQPYTPRPECPVCERRKRLNRESYARTKARNYEALVKSQHERRVAVGLARADADGLC